MLLEDWLLPQETHVFADVCNVDHQNKAGYTPIMLAAPRCRGSREGHASCGRALRLWGCERQKPAR